MEHAMLTIDEDNKVWLEEMARSKNFTTILNDKDINEQRVYLADKDLFTIGDRSFRIHYTQAIKAKTPKPKTPKYSTKKVTANQENAGDKANALPPAEKPLKKSLATPLRRNIRRLQAHFERSC